NSISIPVSLSVFFHTLDLHLFPTRRSSDLFTLSTIAIAEILRLVAINEKWLTGGATGVFISILPEPFGIDFFDKVTQFYLAWCLDRKSTRLNSSHVCTSYAVFCL